LTEAMKKVASQAPLILKGGAAAAVRSLEIADVDSHAVFLRIDPPEGAKPGSAWSFDVTQRDSRTGRLFGGSRYQVVVNQHTLVDWRVTVSIGEQPPWVAMGLP
jgi:hypothetical protein